MILVSTKTKVSIEMDETQYNSKIDPNKEYDIVFETVSHKYDCNCKKSFSNMKIFDSIDQSCLSQVTAKEESNGELVLYGDGLAFCVGVS